MLKIELKQVHVDQVVRFFRKGSILGGTIQSGRHGIEVRVDVESEEPPETIRRLVRIAQESCFTHGALTVPVPVDITVRLNDQVLDPR
jgi:hypothetical protein